ncbi:hypothetical protein Mal64_03070 [Pseudobythopirellula maris]|uniref:Uncharacterized protein n=1 Tax=Pseudobythopirellula maris TaxID=2527991 RepID=A0A5C5ZS60_9BACT|nr:hypothetical protein [Pseudobythopirellula maris]TWT89925.1 hypothetical protein Mal64_03070 [Pseudobythopirellula maris]
MISRRSILSLLLLSSLLGAPGCGESTVENATLKVAETIAPETLLDAIAAEEQQAEKAAAEAPVETTIEQQLAAYEPPFPERVSLFTPPMGAARNARRAGSDRAESVELLGFASVDGPVVVLQIDGVVMPLAIGDEHDGVQVLSAAPPRAVLQRGRNRWTASIQ